MGGAKKKSKVAKAANPSNGSRRSDYHGTAKDASRRGPAEVDDTGPRYVLPPARVGSKMNTAKPSTSKNPKKNMVARGKGKSTLPKETLVQRVMRVHGLASATVLVMRAYLGEEGRGLGKAELLKHLDSLPARVLVGRV
jgi:hypothetical protein